MKRYDSKYFGIAAGIFSILIFLLAVIKSFYTVKVSDYIKPFIPFYNAADILNIIGGIAVSFIWGFVLGYIFAVIYNFFDKTFSKSLL